MTCYDDLITTILVRIRGRHYSGSPENNTKLEITERISDTELCYQLILLQSIREGMTGILPTQTMEPQQKPSTPTENILNQQSEIS